MIIEDHIQRVYVPQLENVNRCKNTSEMKQNDMSIKKKHVNRFVGQTGAWQSFPPLP